MNQEYSVLKENYMTSKIMFSELIESSRREKGLLSQIQEEYDSFIDTLHRGRFQVDFLRLRCKSLAAEPRTLLNLNERTLELEKKIVILKQENERLTHSCKLKRNQSSKLQTGYEERPNRISEGEPLATLKPRGSAIDAIQYAQHDFCALRVLRQAPLTLDEYTDITSLKALLKNLQVKKSNIREENNCQYDLVSKKLDLVEKVKRKDNAMHHLVLYQEKLRERFERLKAAIEVCKESLPVWNVKPKVTMQKAINQAMEEFGKSSRDIQNQYSAFGAQEEDDPEKKKEAEALLEYVEDFNELVGKGDFKLAAWKAAKSPNGILRTFNIMATFKSLEPNGVCKDPWLELCNALMATATCYPPLSGAVSLEIIRCAVKLDKLPLALHWWHTGYLTASKLMGDAISESCTCVSFCKCGRKSLAHVIYDKLECHLLAACCLVGSGQLYATKKYCQQNGFTSNEYMALVQRYPNMELVWLFLNADNDDVQKSLLSLSSVLQILHNINNKSLSAEILCKVIRNGIKSGNGRIDTLMGVLMKEKVSEALPLKAWLDCADICHDFGCFSDEAEIIACITVRNAIHKASYDVLLDYIS